MNSTSKGKNMCSLYDGMIVYYVFFCILFIVEKQSKVHNLCHTLLCVLSIDLCYYCVNFCTWQSKGSNAIAKTASSMSSKFGEESMDTLTDVASGKLSKGNIRYLPNTDIAWDWLLCNTKHWHVGREMKTDKY